MDLKTQLHEEAKELALKLYELNIAEERLSTDKNRVLGRLKELHTAFATMNSLNEQSEKKTDGTV